jgi:YD repeat-containing protein
MEVAPLGASTSTLTYTYDAAGRRSQMRVTGQTAVTYGYDDAHRITGITQGTNVVGFTYDAASRRTQATLPNGVTIDYAYESGVCRFGAGSCAVGA